MDNNKVIIMRHHMITRSKGNQRFPLTPSLSNKDSDNVKDNKGLTITLFTSLYINYKYNNDIDFDEASSAWMSNKCKLGNGEYKYIN